MGLFSKKEQIEFVGSRTKKQEIVGLIICIAFVVLFIWLGFKSWHSFIDLEENGKDLKVDSLTYVLYNLGGKYLATSIWVLLTLLFTFLGVKRLKGYKSAEE